MFVISFWASFGFSAWWNFSHRDYVIEKLEESKRKPLIALFTDSNTSQSLLTEFQAFTNSLVLNVTATHINCSNSSFCNSLPTFPIPSVQIIRGPTAKYWSKTTELKESCWLELLNSSMPSLSKEISSSAELNESIAKTVNGGTSFHLVTSNRTRTALRMYREAAEYYSIFGCSFTYSLDATGFSLLAGFRADRAVIKKTIRPLHIEKFIADNRFSLSHVFDYNEFLIVIKERPIVLLLKNITNPYSNISFELYSDFNFGFMDLDSNPKMRSLFGDDIPLIIGYNARRDCLVQSEVINNDFLENVAKTRDCMAVSVIGRNFRFGEHPGRSWPFGLVAVFIFGIIGCAGFGSGRSAKARKKKENSGSDSRFGKTEYKHLCK